MTKAIIISGAAGNLGRAVTQKFLDNGFHVEAILGPGDDPGFMEANELRAQSVNLLDEEASKVFVEKVAGSHDELCGAVMIVGGFSTGNLLETDAASLQKMYKLNFETAFFLARPLLKILESQENGGQLVFIGSRPAINPEEGKDLVAYSLSKSLVFGLVDLVNATYKGKDISAAVVVPGTMDTPGNRAAMPEADFSRWVPTSGVANAIHYLFTDTGRMLSDPVIKIYSHT